ncbi:MAG TPA: hypothetical protein PKU91_04250, partial [Phycisphaerales bacterium]|nr:hypothetical protein [Phycisphaerales bacterium]
MKLRGASTPALRSFLSAAAALAVVVLLTASTNAQVVIELRSTARVAHDERLTLAHIAELTGPDAARWATVEIDAHEPGSASGRAGKTSWVRIGVDRVREAVAEQPDVHWGRILIRGSTCDVARLSPTDHPPHPAP